MQQSCLASLRATEFLLLIRFDCCVQRGVRAASKLRPSAAPLCLITLISHLVPLVRAAITTVGAANKVSRALPPLGARRRRPGWRAGRRPATRGRRLATPRARLCWAAVAAAACSLGGSTACRFRQAHRRSRGCWRTSRRSRRCSAATTGAGSARSSRSAALAAGRTSRRRRSWC